jgi:hypothetical protein
MPNNSIYRGLFFHLLLTCVLSAVTQASLAADFSRVRPERAGMSSERLERLDAVLRSYVDKGQVADR